MILDSLKLVVADSLVQMPDGVGGIPDDAQIMLVVAVVLVAAIAALAIYGLYSCLR